MSQHDNLQYDHGSLGLPGHRSAASTSKARVTGARRLPLASLATFLFAGVSVLPLLATATFATGAEPKVMQEERNATLRLRPDRHRLSRLDLEIWNDPGFRREFINSYAAVTEVEPSIDSDEVEVMQSFLEYQGSDDMASAERVLRDARSPASSAVIDFTLANLHFERGELDRAASLYQVAIDKFERFRRAHKNLGVIRIQQEDFKQAIEPLTEAIKLGDRSGITYGLLAYAYSNIDDDLAAESAYRMAVMLDPGTVDWKMGLARSFFKQQRFADAVAVTRSLLEAAPERTDLWLLQANAYLGLGEPMRAAENYELVDRLGGSTVDSLIMLGDIYVNEGLFDIAATRYEQTFDLEPRVAPERVIRAAKILASRGALEQTGALIDRIGVTFGEEIADSDRKDLLKLRARIAVAAGSSEDEARILEEIVALDPLDGEALILLGQQAERTGDEAKAVFWFERAAGLERFEADAKLRHGQMLVRQGRFKEALPLLRSAQQLKPREAVQAYMQQVERLARGQG